MEILPNIAGIIFTLVLGYYAICAAQWYSYKLERVIFHYAKPLWHINFAALPFCIFSLFLAFLPDVAIVWAVFYALCVIYWAKKMAGKLNYTKRVLRYFALLVLFSLLCLLASSSTLVAPCVLIAVLLAFYASAGFERLLALKYQKDAKNKLASLNKLKIVLITASYGKTSIKNYLAHLLAKKYKVHASPRSVNTLMGLVKDINENISADTQVFIAEAGARLKGDIAVISRFLNPHFVIIGQIGTAHLEYFKSEQAIRETKLEALKSSRLSFALLHSSTLCQDEKNCVIYDKKIKEVKSSLSGLNFGLELESGLVNVGIPNLLGEFNAYNAAAAALMAEHLGLSADEICGALSELKNTEHRLSKMEAGGKIIIDDGFNGNFDGMSASYALVSSHAGRKVLVTPGIMEGAKGVNARLSEIINEIFDLVIITSALNANELKSALKKPQIIELKSKAELVGVLASNTRAGDLVLFSNDAPEYM